MHAPSHVLYLALALAAVACGGETEQVTEPANVAANAETETTPGAEDTEASADTEPSREAPPGADEAPPQPEGSVTEPVPVPGTPASVRIDEVRAREQGAPAEMTAEIEAVDRGYVRVVLSGYTSYCAPEPSLLAHLDGGVIRLYSAPTDMRSRCVRPYDVTLLIGPLQGGSYEVQVGRPGQGEPAQIGEVEVAAYEAHQPGAPRLEQALAVNHAEAEATDGETGVGLGEVTPAGPGVTRMTLRAGLPCTGGAPVLFGAYRDGERLILRPHHPSRIARCAAVIRPYAIVVETGDFTPAAVVLQDRMGEVVAESEVAAAGG